VRLWQLVVALVARSAPGWPYPTGSAWRALVAACGGAGGTIGTELAQPTQQHYASKLHNVTSDPRKFESFEIYPVNKTNSCLDMFKNNCATFSHEIIL